MITYPLVAGHQGGDTDMAAADTLEDIGRAESLRILVLNVMERFPQGLTADECAEKMNENVLSIRPRFTELKIRGYLIDTGWRRPSSNGKLQRVLKLNHDPQNTLSL